MLDDALAGRALVEERLGLLVEAPGLTAFALNELALEKTVAGHMVRVSTSVNGEHLLTYAADGVIVATPTGSTAYNLSAGGPVVSPGLDVLLLTPVAPHFTIDRSIVLGPDETVELTVLPDRPAVLVADGSMLAPLEPETTVRVSTDPVPSESSSGARHGVGGRLRAQPPRGPPLSDARDAARAQPRRGRRRGHRPADGLTVLTGETGVGKTLFVEALHLVLGGSGPLGPGPRTLTRPAGSRRSSSAPRQRGRPCPGAARRTAGCAPPSTARPHRPSPRRARRTALRAARPA